MPDALSYNRLESFNRGGEKMSLSDSVMYLGGVGPKRAELLKKLDTTKIRIKPKKL